MRFTLATREASMRECVLANTSVTAKLFNFMYCHRRDRSRRDEQNLHRRGTTTQANDEPEWLSCAAPHLSCFLAEPLGASGKAEFCVGARVCPGAQVPKSSGARVAVVVVIVVVVRLFDVCSPFTYPFLSSPNLRLCTVKERFTLQWPLPQPLSTWSKYTPPSRK